MADPASWQLLEALQDIVSGITVANGYLSDLGLQPVVLDDADLGEEDAGTVIEAGDITVTSQSTEHVNYDLDVLVEFGIPRGLPGTNAKRLIHCATLDLARALLIKPRDLPRCVRTFEQTAARMVSGEDASGASFLVAQVTARAGLTETKSPASS